ncbi:MAG: tetratricopeptide repeat protein [Burkholderiaceae bacterium]|nr:tetratricopeptide repeat protein [Burkholderiaceae bacterium]
MAKNVSKSVQTEAEALYFLGNRRMTHGDAAGAEACFREALRIHPEFAEACGNLGLMLERRGVIDDAENCYRRALTLNPKLAELHLNLSALLIRQKCLTEAELVCQHALALTPQSPAAWSNLGAVYACLQREAEAEACYRHAIELDNQHVSSRFNLGYLLLRQGQFEEGWHCLEARDWYAALAARLDCPRWQGEALAGKSVLIGYEAGHGDMIQFCRYAAVLKAQGASRVDIICHPALATLFATLDGADAIYPFDQPYPHTGWDYWSPPMSLPYYCETRLDSVPAAIPYLHADPARVAQWRALLPQHGIRVGLVWKGNPKFENDADRSLPNLSVLAPLRTVPGVAFVSLQKIYAEDEAARLAAEWPLLELGSSMADFADTAAIVENLDLVICIDTAVAHLAGALGRRCWVMLPDYKTDWRWLTGRSDSPWYPQSMRLFRQSVPGDWAGVADRLTVALKAFVAGCR